MQENIAQFCSITGASAKDAKRMLERHKRLDAAVDAFYSGPTPASPARSAGPSTSKITTLFDKYKGASALRAVPHSSRSSLCFLPWRIASTISPIATLSLCAPALVNPTISRLLYRAPRSPHICVSEPAHTVHIQTRSRQIRRRT